MNEDITVLIVDDHSVVRHGIRALLEAEDGFSVVGGAGSGGEAVLLAKDLAPDVFLMDLMMPEMNGVEATRLLKHESPCSQIVPFFELTIACPDGVLQEQCPELHLGVCR